MSRPQVHTPVVLLAFNRPEHTRRVLERISEVRPARVFIVADGPRRSVPDEAERCSEVRGVVEQLIDWPCEVVRHYSDENMGCASRVSSGISSVFQAVEEAIILEDDCLPDTTFFQFCDELLDRFRDERRVSQIGGTCFDLRASDVGGSYRFSAYAHCWGWASWRRAWSEYRSEIPNFREIEALRSRSARERRYWKCAIDGMRSGQIDSWAYRWQFSNWRLGAASVVPSSNLVTNIGFGSGATHTSANSKFSGMKSKPIQFPLLHPGEIQIDTGADEKVSERMFARPALPLRVLNRMLGRRSG